MATQKIGRCLAVLWGLCAGMAACGGSDLESDRVQTEAEHGRQDSQLLQAPYAYRNSDAYNLANEGGRYVELVVATSPAQPFAAVHAWRTHQQGANPGAYGNNGDLVGYTNPQGVFEQSGYLPFDISLCGVYADETFAVGSVTGPRSSPISFRIYVSPTSGPHAPGCHR
ncbi:hypothetical protein [Myxococcus faecalis]|uniref:hypothetical protein n=1 Tax=Myxococcus faecalis TaxID=3115646 RepID=UPI003CEE5355